MGKHDGSGHVKREIMYPLRVLEQVMGKNETNGTKDMDGEEEEFDALDIIDRAKQMTMQSPQQNNDEAFECDNDQQRLKSCHSPELSIRRFSCYKRFENVFNAQYKKWHVQDTWINGTRTF